MMAYACVCGHFQGVKDEETVRRELEQAKNTLDQAKQKIEQNTQQNMERASQADDKVKD